MSYQICIFCGGDPAAPEHRDRCNGPGAHLGGFEVRLDPAPVAVDFEDLEDLEDDDQPYRPYQSHSITSAAAAGSIARELAITLRERVYQYIRSRGPLGATDDEIQVALQMEGSTERPRRVELHNAGRIINSGNKRETRSGRRAVVWVIVNA